jgi:hypothetical protein
MSKIRITFDYDPDPDFSWLELMRATDGETWHTGELNQWRHVLCPT